MKTLFSPHFAKRVNLNQDEMLELIDQVVEAFNLGKLVDAEGIEIGYEDVNITITTDSGKYLLKILIDFTQKKPRSEEDSRRYVDTMETLRSEGVPVPRLYKAGDDFLLKKIIPHNEQPIWMLVMEFFEGVDFITQKPSLDDIRNVAQILSKINLSGMKRKPVYDPWQPQFFLEEYSENVKILKSPAKEIIEELVPKYKKMDLKSLPKAPIHADFMRNNILKNKNGDYCVLDFGVVNLAPRISDLSVFLAGFCMDPEVSIEDNKKAYELGLNEYRKYVELNDEEKEHLPTMVKATYAMFYIAALWEKVVDDNQTEENDYWIWMGEAGLKMCKEMGL